jgi:diguanylate cyclase (GGDEF)-like protein
MDGAQVILAVNIAVAGLFALAYATLALASPAQRRVLWFSASYAVGMASPAADSSVPLFGHPVLMEWVSFVCILAAFLGISAAFSLFYRRRPPWLMMGAILVGGVVLRALIWSWRRDTLGYGMAYQLPFMLASALAVRTVLQAGDARPLNRGLAAAFALLAAHFLIKPYLATTFGPGKTIGDYTHTIYALLSQASSGVLLLAAGLLMLLIVAQTAILETQRQSETDLLSGLYNRRAFDRRAEEAVLHARQTGQALSVAMFDLDHFKRVNDRHGHAAGDAVIEAFAALLRRTVPDGLYARQDGDTFVLLMESASAEVAWLAADSIRASTPRVASKHVSRLTVSGGVAQLNADESLAELMRRADQAAYQAKGLGRDRIGLSGASRPPAASETLPTGDAASASADAS